MFSMCSELTPSAPIPDSRIAQYIIALQLYWNYVGTIIILYFNTAV